MIVLGTLIALITAIGVTRTVSTVAKDGYRRVPTLGPEPRRPSRPHSEQRPRSASATGALS